MWNNNITSIMPTALAFPSNPAEQRQSFVNENASCCPASRARCTLSCLSGGWQIFVLFTKNICTDISLRGNMFPFITPSRFFFPPLAFIWKGESILQSTFWRGMVHPLLWCVDTECLSVFKGFRRNIFFWAGKRNTGRCWGKGGYIRNEVQLIPLALEVSLWT